MANEDALPAGCVAGAGYCIRSQDFDAGEVWDRGVAELDTGLEIGSLRLVALEQVIDSCGSLFDEGNDNRLRAGFDRNLDFEGSLAALLPAPDVIVGNRFEVQECDA